MLSFGTNSTRLAKYQLIFCGFVTQRSAQLFAICTTILTILKTNVFVWNIALRVSFYWNVYCREYKVHTVENVRLIVYTKNEIVHDTTIDSQQCLCGLCFLSTGCDVPLLIIRLLCLVPPPFHLYSSSFSRPPILQANVSSLFIFVANKPL